MIWRSLAAARLAHKGQCAAGHDMHIEPIKHGDQRPGWVAESDVAQLYVSQQEAQLLACEQQP